MDYFRSKSQKLLIAGGTDPRPPLKINDYGMCKDFSPTEHFWLMQMLGNFEAKGNIFHAPIPLFKKTFSRHRLELI